MDTRGNRLYLKFLGYAHWFMSIRISQIKDPSISVDQYRYDTSVVANNLDTATIKENSKFHKTSLPRYMKFTKEDSSKSYEQVGVLSIQYNINYKSCLVSIIYIFLKEFIYVLHYTSWKSFHQTLVKYNLRS